MCLLLTARVPWKNVRSAPGAGCCGHARGDRLYGGFSSQAACHPPGTLPGWICGKDRPGYGYWRGMALLHAGIAQFKDLDRHLQGQPVAALLQVNLAERLQALQALD